MIWDEGLLFVWGFCRGNGDHNCIKKNTELKMNSMNYKTLTCTVLAVQQAGGIINTCLFVISTTALTVILHLICLDYRESY